MKKNQISLSVVMRIAIQTYISRVKAGMPPMPSMWVSAGEL
jgi:hypothetical protein